MACTAQGCALSCFTDEQSVSTNPYIVQDMCLCSITQGHIRMARFGKCQQRMRIQKHIELHVCLMLTGPLGMDNPLWDALPIKVGHLVHVDNVLHQHWATLPDCHHGILVVNGDTMAGGQLVSHL